MTGWPGEIEEEKSPIIPRGTGSENAQGMGVVSSSYGDEFTPGGLSQDTAQESSPEED